MNNYFYYIGFIYIAESIRMIWKSFQPVTDKDKVLNINDKMDVGELLNTTQAYRQKNKSNILSYIVGLIFFIWLIIGYKSNTPEKYLFLCNAIFIVFHWVFIFSIGMYFAVKAFLGNKAEIHNDVKKPTISINMGLIVPLVELLIVLCIMYHHFFITI